jgi:hypothetical protein
LRNSTLTRARVWFVWKTELDELEQIEHIVIPLTAQTQ